MAKFEKFEYGTEKYCDAMKKLTGLQNELKEKSQAWEQLMLELG